MKTKCFVLYVTLGNMTRQYPSVHHLQLHNYWDSMYNILDGNISLCCISTSDGVY